MIVQSLITAASALAGAAVGGWSTYRLQERRWRLDARSGAFAEFVVSATAWLDALDRLSFAVEADLPREHRWDDANTARTRAVAARARLQMLVAATDLPDRALDVEAYLRHCHDEIFERDQRHDRSRRTDVRGAFDAELDTFVAAAVTQLGL